MGKYIFINFINGAMRFNEQYMIRIEDSFSDQLMGLYYHNSYELQLIVSPVLVMVLSFTSQTPYKALSL